MALELRAVQQQKASQNMIMQVSILQMSTPELAEYMKEVALENPVAELEENERETEEKDRLKKLEWLSSMDEQNRVYYKQEAEAEDEGDIFNLAVKPGETLDEVLQLQLMKEEYTKKDQEVFEFIIGCLDERGYFTESVEEIAGQTHTTTAHAAKCLDIMKHLEPKGVCAAGLKECLLIQLDPEDEDLETERTIITEYLELLGKNQLHVIAKKMGLPVSRIVEALEKIRTLNPRPSRGYASREVLKYLTPDIVIVKMKDYFEILIDEYSYPELRINDNYMRMMRSNECDKEVTHYLSDKVRQIEQIQDCVKKRNNNLLMLAQYLVNYQQEFFQKGKGHLKTLTMQDVADEFGVHESTISRTVKEKYLQCCWGIFPLEYFFSKGFYESGNREVLPTESIKETLKTVIENENRKKPLSDQKLSEELAKHGIEISRRTVAKYRESMGIPDCRGRKEFS